MVVSFVNCDSFRPDCVGLESGSSAKVVDGVEGFGSRFATLLDSASKSSSSRFLFRLLVWLKIDLRPFWTFRVQEGAMFAGLPLRLPSSCKISKFGKFNVLAYRYSYDFPDSDCLNLEWFS